VLFALEILLPEVSNRTFLPVVIATDPQRRSAASANSSSRHRRRVHGCSGRFASCVSQLRRTPNKFAIRNHAFAPIHL
jgi:hypothetical protein